MTSLQALILSTVLWLPPSAAVLAAEAGPPAPARHHRRKPAASAVQTSRPDPETTPMFEGSERPETAADRAASLERRRKAFFAPSPAGSDHSPSPPVGVTLGGSDGLTPGLGLKF